MAENEQFGISEQLDDTISRAAVVDAIEGVDWYHINKNGEMVHGANDNDHQAWYKAEDIYKAVESVPSAQQWISCKERLPEYGTAVLTYNNDDEYEINHIIDEDDGEWFFNGAVAWMPLPEPYNGEQE